MSEFVKTTGAGGPRLNTDALRAAGKSFMSSGQTPAAASEATPASTSAEPATPSTSSTPSLVQSSEVSVRPAGEQPVSTPSAAQPAQSQPTGAADAPKFIDLPDDQLVRVTVNGQEEIKPWGEAKKHYMLHSTFTQNQQKLKAREAEIEARLREADAKSAESARLAEENAKLTQLVSDPELYARYAAANPMHAAYLAKQFGSTVAQLSAGASPQAQAAAVAGQQPSGIPSDPNELINAGELQRAIDGRVSQFDGRFQSVEQKLEAYVQQVLGQVDKTVNEKLAMLQDAHEVVQFNQAISKTIDESLTANPALRAIPHVAELIRFEVGKLQPGTLAETAEAVDYVAKGIIEQLDQTYNQSRSAQLIAKERLVTEGIEPPAGVPVNNIVKPQSSLMLPGGKMDWNAMRARGKAVLGS